MYRAVAWRALATDTPIDDGEAVAALAARTAIELADGGRTVVVDGEDVTSALRARDVTSASSRISMHPAVRRQLVARQRALGAAGGVVLDGRDIGTAVFPEAEVKFYVDADPRRRAERRHEELAKAGVASEVDAIEREIRERDHRDSTRSDSPLTRAGDAVHIDTTGLEPEEVVARMLAVVGERLSATSRP